MASTSGIGGPIAGTLGNILDEVLALVAVFTTATMVEMLLYGMHLILFCICMLLFLRNKRSKQWFIFVSAVVMFLLSTVDIAITFRLVSYDMPKLADSNTAAVATIGMQLVHAKMSIFVANNFVAELILLYRCWMVWDRSKFILAGCSVLVLADTQMPVWGFLGLGPELSLLTLLTPISKRFVSIYIWSILAINIILTFVTIGRIFWISRIAKRLVGQKQISVYHTAIAMLVESSLVYSICVLLYVLFPSSNPYRITILLFTMRVVTIMPTLLIVQVGLGAVVQEINLTASSRTLRFEVRPNSVVLDTIRSSRLHGNQHSEAVFPSSLHDEEADSSQTIELTNVSKSKTVAFKDRRPRTVDYATQ